MSLPGSSHHIVGTVAYGGRSGHKIYGKVGLDVRIRRSQVRSPLKGTLRVMGMKGVISRDGSPAGVIGSHLLKEGKLSVTPAFGCLSLAAGETMGFSEIRKSSLCLHLMQRAGTRTVMA